MLSEDLATIIHDLTDLPRYPTRAAELRFQSIIDRLDELRKASLHTDLIAKGNGVGAATLRIARALEVQGVRPASDFLGAERS